MAAGLEDRSLKTTDMTPLHISASFCIPRWLQDSTPTTPDEDRSLEATYISHPLSVTASSPTCWNRRPLRKLKTICRQIAFLGYLLCRVCCDVLCPSQRNARACVCAVFASLCHLAPLNRLFWFEIMPFAHCPCMICPPLLHLDSPCALLPPSLPLLPFATLAPKYLPLLL